MARSATRSRSVWTAVRRLWRRHDVTQAPPADPELAVHAAAPLDPEPLSDHERRALAAWQRAPGQTIAADEAKRRLLAANEADQAAPE